MKMAQVLKSTKDFEFFGGATLTLDIPTEPQIG